MPVSSNMASSGVLIMGEGLGRAGQSFCPDTLAGSVLDRLIRRCGFTPDEFAISSVVTQLEGDQAVHQVRPKVILVLGDSALQAVVDVSGPKQSVRSLRGYVLGSNQYRGVHVIATYHPTFLRRGGKSRDRETGARTAGTAGKGGPHLFGVACFDLKRAVEVAAHGYSFTAPAYIERPTIEEARGFLEQVRYDPTATVAYDIETANSASGEEESLEAAAREIYQIQFSISPGTGICFPWRGEFIDVAKEILATENPKAAHNGRKFDNPILRTAGVNFGGILYDTMEIWQRLQPDLPAGLQFVASFFKFPFPWKHLAGTEPEFYGCADADAAQRLAQALPEALRTREPGEVTSYMY